MGKSAIEHLLARLCFFKEMWHEEVNQTYNRNKTLVYTRNIVSRLWVIHDLKRREITPPPVTVAGDSQGGKPSKSSCGWQGRDPAEHAQVALSWLSAPSVHSFLTLTHH